MLTATEEQTIKTEIAALREQVRTLEVKIEALEMARPVRAVTAMRLHPDRGGAMREVPSDAV